jgi:hypothetical protein
MLVDHRNWHLVLLLTTTVPAWSDSPADRLSPQQLESIRLVGQAVLQAKKSATPDPDLGYLCPSPRKGKN